MAAAIGARSYVQVSNEGGEPPETLTVATNGVDVVATSAEYRQIGGEAYFTGSQGLGLIGVNPTVAKTDGSKWYSASSTSPGVASVFAGLAHQFSELSISHPVKQLVSASEVIITGVSPTDASTNLTLTVAGTAPYLAEQLRETFQTTTLALTFSKWNAISPLTTPSASPLSAILVPTGEQSILSKISLGSGDLPSGVQAIVLYGGLEVAGQITLDLCSNTYASEVLRVDRRQMATLQSDGTTFTFSTEAVIYQDPAATLTAFAEIRTATAHCQEGSDSAIGASWPAVAGVQRLAYVTPAESSPATDTSPASDIIYLRRGRILIGLYLNGTATTMPFAVAGSTSIETIVHVFEERLAALPASAVA
jgi:hypothetical protein